MQRKRNRKTQKIKTIGRKRIINEKVKLVKKKIRVEKSKGREIKGTGN